MKKTSCSDNIPEAVTVITLPPGSTGNDLQTAVTSALSGDIIEITDDVIFSSPINIEEGKTVTLSGPALSSAEPPKRLLTIDTRHFTINGELILQNITLDGENAGGGVQVLSGGNLTIDYGTLIHNCLNVTGGAVYVAEGGNFSMFGGELRNNRAVISGGGIFLSSSSFMRGEMNIINGMIINNTASYGGGFYAGQYSTVNIGQTFISGNYATINGGGIYINSYGTLNMNYSVININTSNGCGGGIFGNTGSHITVMNGTQIGGYGFNEGNIAVTGGGICLYGDFNDSTDLIVRDSVIGYNHANLNGGGIAGAGDASSPVNININIENNTDIMNNTAFVSGGGIYSFYNSTLVIYNSRITANSAANGGGIYASSPNNAYPAFVNISYSSIVGNSAVSGGGGGIYGANNYNFNIYQTLLLDNTATADGGGIFIDSANRLSPAGIEKSGFLNIDGGTIENNTAFRGGGIGVSAEIYSTSGNNNSIAEVNIFGGTRIIRNNATDGGGIWTMTYAVSGANSITNINVAAGSYIEDNVAQNGGGIFAQSITAQGTANTEVMVNGSVTGNTAYNNGGGIYSTAGGDLIGFSSCYVNIINTSVNRNGAINNGGGIYTIKNGADNITCSVNIRDSGLFNNTALYGGGIFGGNNSVIETMGCLIEYNGEFMFIYGNPFGPVRNGGGIYLTFSAVLTMNDSNQLLNNIALEGDGGGIYTEDLSYSNLFTSDGVLFIGNRASTAFIPPPDARFLFPNIGFAGVSIFEHPLNNFDINYTVGMIASFNIFYEANGGEGSFVGPDIPPGGIDIILSPFETGILREGYTFSGWNTQADGSGEFYWAGQQIILEDNVTLYAQWTLIDLHYVMYISNGGIGGHVDYDISAGSLYTVRYPYEIGVIREGSLFTEWNTAPDATGTSYLPGDTITIFEDVILYAIWVPQEFTIDYNANGGTGSFTAIENYGTLHQILSSQETGITRENYIFVSWNTESDGSGITYMPTDILNVTDNIVLYAQWQINTFTVMYESNGGEGTFIENDIPFGEEYTVLSPDDAGIGRDGFVFLEWNTLPDGSGIVYIPGDTIIITENVVLYAQWGGGCFTVTYNSNGGKGCCKIPCVPFDSEHVILTQRQACVKRRGCRFTCWNTSPDGLGTAYFPCDTITITGNLELYAQWI